MLLKLQYFSKRSISIDITMSIKYDESSMDEIEEERFLLEGENRWKQIMKELKLVALYWSWMQTMCTTQGSIPS